MVTVWCVDIAIHPEEQLLVTAAIDGTVKTWSLENFEMVLLCYVMYFQFVLVS
jgi:hypothetical protein